MTSIKTQKYSKHTNWHKSAALYLQLRPAPAHLASRLQGRVGEGVSHISREEVRQEKENQVGTETPRGGRWRWSTGEQQQEGKGREGRVHLPCLSPQRTPYRTQKASLNEGGCRHRGKRGSIGRGGVGEGQSDGQNGTNPYPKPPTPLCHSH